DVQQLRDHPGRGPPRPGRHLPARLPTAARDARQLDHGAARAGEERAARCEPGGRGPCRGGGGPAGDPDAPDEGAAGVSERDDERQAAADTAKPGSGEVGAQSTTEAALEAGGQNIPAGPRGGRTQLEVTDVRRGMFGVHGSGDTSGFGGLVTTVAMRPASERPYGGWFDEVV